MPKIEKNMNAFLVSDESLAQVSGGGGFPEGGEEKVQEAVDKNEHKKEVYPIWGTAANVIGITGLVGSAVCSVSSLVCYLVSKSNKSKNCLKAAKALGISAASIAGLGACGFAVGKIGRRVNKPQGDVKLTFDEDV